MCATGVEPAGMSPITRRPWCSHRNRATPAGGCHAADGGACNHHRAGRSGAHSVRKREPVPINVCPGATAHTLLATTAEIGRVPVLNAAAYALTLPDASAAAGAAAFGFTIRLPVRSGETHAPGNSGRTSGAPWCPRGLTNCQAQTERRRRRTMAPTTTRPASIMA